MANKMQISAELSLTGFDGQNRAFLLEVIVCLVLSKMKYNDLPHFLQLQLIAFKDRAGTNSMKQWDPSTRHPPKIDT